MLRWKMILASVILISLSEIVQIFADDNFKRWESPRDYEPVIIGGEFVAEFLGLPVDEIFAYSYDATESSWRQVPLQIDERDDSSHIWIPDSLLNNVLDTRDQILFMARDMGDRVPGDYSWIDDESSKNTIRYEITAGDPTEPGEQAFLYLYHSTTLQDTVRGYMDYIPVDDPAKANDYVVAEGYKTSNTDLGIPNYVEITARNGGDGVDLIDRLKIRLTALAYSFITLDETEEFLRDPSIEYKLGKIRISRRINYIAYLFGQPTLPFSIPMYYYPFTSRTELSFNLNVSSVNVFHFRQSIDLSPEANGMRFYSNFNSDVPIDGNPDLVDTTVIFDTEGQHNWHLITGDHGSVLNLFSISAEANTRLYYYDNSAGGTGDGKKDTGDMESWGDLGILKTGESLKKLGVPYTTYFLPRNQDAADIPDFAEKFTTPFILVRKIQTYQEPVKVLVSVPDTTARAFSTLNLPIRISDVTGLSIKSIKFNLRYDTSMLQFAGVTTDNTIAMAWVNYYVVVKNDGVDIQISGNTSLSGSGDLAYIEFGTSGVDGDTTTIKLQDVEFNVPGAYPETKDGLIRLTPPQVVLSLPDTTAMSQDSVSIPVRISGVAGKGVVEINMMISFNSKILNAVSISKENTVVSEWTNFTFNDFSNRSHIILSGDEAISKDGTLIYIKFAVTGADGSGTALAFMTAVCNTGSVIALKNNGYLRVEGVIPVELASFNASVVKGAVVLNWQTLSESNNYGFEVERKSTANSEWKNIAFIRGNGTSQRRHDYTFIDEPADAGSYNYRLKQIDFDGSFSYSNETMVNLSVPVEFILAQNYPNPFNPITHIDYELPDIDGKEIQVELAIYNLLGEKIRTLVTEKQDAGYYSVKWDGSDDWGNSVTTGIYIYRLRANEFVSTKRMVYLK